MKHTGRKLVSLLLIPIMLCGMLGCDSVRGLLGGKEDPAKPQQAPSLDIGILPPDPTQAAPTAAPTPTPSASERFQALDRSFFTDFVTDDGYTFHQMVTSAANFDIDASAVPMTFGDFSEEANRALAEEYAAYLEQLLDIPREELTEREQMTYDVLQQYWELCIDDAQYEYFYEPLTRDVGLQSNLPLAMALYELRTEEDVKNYLLLMTDVPRYLGQVMAYEQQRAEQGMFMTEAALDAVIRNLNDIIEAGDTLFLIGAFQDYIGEIDAIPPERADAYIQQNKTLVADMFLPSYEMLRDGLEALRPSCSAPEGMCAMGSKGLSYFETRLQIESNTMLSVDEALELLESTTSRLLIEYSTLYMNNPSIATLTQKITTGDTAADLAYLEVLSLKTLGELPEHTLVVEAVPEELEKQMSAAAYVIPALDDYVNNTVLSNTASTSETPLFTTAHETYFGHLYQYVLQRSNQALGLSQRVLPHGGLAEGWAQVGPEIMIRAQTKFDADYCMFHYYNSLILNTLLPAIISILVNYQAYDSEQVTAYLTGFGLSAPEITQIYLDYAYNMPFYTFEYAIGYSTLSDMLLTAQNELGEAYDQKAYLAKLMDLGPACFNLLQERMDVWTDEQVAE